MSGEAEKKFLEGLEKLSRDTGLIIDEGCLVEATSAEMASKSHYMLLEGCRVAWVKPYQRRTKRCTH